MVSENLLATYSLLSFIQDSQKEDKSKSILQLFIPIVQDTLNWMLSQNANTGEIKGKSTLEIRDVIKMRFELEIPPFALNSILSLIDTDENRFVINALTLRHQSLREEKKENRTVILTFVVLRKD